MTRVFVDIGGLTTRDAAGGTGMRPIGMRPTPNAGTITTETARTCAGLPCLIITMRGDSTPDLFPTLLKEADGRGALAGPRLWCSTQPIGAPWSPSTASGPARTF